MNCYTTAAHNFNPCGHLRAEPLHCSGMDDQPCVGGIRGQAAVACHGFSGRCCVCQGRAAWAQWERAHPPLEWANAQQAEAV